MIRQTTTAPSTQHVVRVVGAAVLTRPLVRHAAWRILGRCRAHHHDRGVGTRYPADVGARWRMDEHSSVDSNGTSGWDELPAELLEELTTALAPSDLPACRLACQHWSGHLSPRSLSVSGPAPGAGWEGRFRRLTELTWAGVRPDQLRAAGRLGELTRLNALLVLEEDSGEGGADGVVPGMLAEGGLRRLASLGLTGGSCYLTDAGVAGLAAALPGLTFLRLEPGPLVTSGAGLTGLASLRSLSLEGMGFYPHRLLASLDTGLSALTSLSLGHVRACRAVREDATLEAMVASLPALTSLKLTVGRGVTEAGLGALGGLSALRVLDLSGSPLGDVELEGLSTLTALQDLCLASCDLSDECLTALAPLTCLTALDLSFPEFFEDLFREDWLEELADLTALRTLSLAGCRDIDAAEGMTHLTSLPSLTDLDLGRTGVMHDRGDLRWLLRHTGLVRLKLGESPFVCDADVQLVAASLTNLTALDLSRPSAYPAFSAFWSDSHANVSGGLHDEACELTDNALTALGGLPALASLRLDNCLSITDAGLSSLASMPSLSSLSLAGCEQLTDAGLEHLTCATSLAVLDLSDCVEMSPAALDSLRAALPGLKLLHGQGRPDISPVQMRSAG